MNNKPIGIVDTGVGGLSVWKEIQFLLPEESTIYLADSLHCPYGNRTDEEIHRLSHRLIRFLLEQDVKAIVIACNTITVAALDKLRKEFPEIPMIGTVPVVKKAAAITKTNTIGILSTKATAKSEYQKKLIQTFAMRKKVINKGTDSLVPLVERGIVKGERIERILQKELEDFMDAQVDVISLGCTHYPFLKTTMQKILGKSISLLDSGPAIARQLERILSANDIRAREEKVRHRLYTTGELNMFQLVITTLLGDIKAEYKSVAVG